MTKRSLNELQIIAKEVRKDTIDLIYKAGSGHPAGSLSAADIFVALYFSILNYDPKNPNWEDRDRFILSNGHVCPSLFAVMARAGYFERSLLTTYTQLNSVLQGHPERTKLSGIETTSGPLGLGLAQAVGIALAAEMDKKEFKVFCMASDAEHDEGNHWEAVLLAAKYKLSNLILFVDRNMIQIEQGTEQTLPLGDLGEKYSSFGWNVLNIDGHNFEEILRSTDSAKSFSKGPTVIIAKTTAGKGVSFMEDSPDWHAKAPNESEYKKAIEELG